MIFSTHFHRMFVLSIAALLAAPATARAQGAPVCTYQSETYSDGAYVCAQRALMQQCAVSGASASWKIVTDDRLSRLCLGPVARRDGARRVAKLRPHRRAAAAVVDPNAKCFQFNGKRYCE
ncbi:MAG: hypothetical protein ACOY4O_01240 [Pseudomonadota bacterium]